MSLSTNSNSLNLTQYILNGKPYFISVNIFNSALGYDVLILNNMIEQIRIDNDIDSFYPRCLIVFNDAYGNYTNKYTNFGLYLRIFIKPPMTTR